MKIAQKKVSPCLGCEYEKASKHNHPICENCDDRMNYADGMGVAGIRDKTADIRIIKDFVDLNSIEKIEVPRRIIQTPVCRIKSKGMISFNVDACHEFKLFGFKSMEVYRDAGPHRTKIYFKFYKTDDKPYHVNPYKNYIMFRNTSLCKLLNLKIGTYNVKKMSEGLLMIEVKNEG